MFRPTRVQPATPPARPELAFEPAPCDPTPVDFASLRFDPRLRQGINDRGFVRTTPVQSAVFPLLAQGGDLITCAQTGTGKTAAFLLPLMQLLLDEGAPAGRTRVLVLAPTRELALQIDDDFQGFAYHTTLTSAAVYGGVDGDPQMRALRAGVHLIVATPGRLLDHMGAGIPDFGAVDVLVLDEADRMLDMGFWPDVRRIVAALPAERQTLMFSATTSRDVIELAGQVMRRPRYVQMGGARKPASTITHVAHILPRGDKIDWLARFLRRTDEPALVFVRTKRGADRLGQQLAGTGIRCTSLHADRTQSQRTAAVEGFKGGRYKVLVATDVAARGLDIEGIGHVINFEVPESPDLYLHRVGRTGRAEATGTALTLVAPEEVPALRVLERSFDLRIEQAGEAAAAVGSW